MSRKRTYSTWDAVLRDVDAFVATRAETTGHWTLAQILEHLARSIDHSLDGFGFRGGVLLRLFGRFFVKDRVLKNAMPPGYELPRQAAEALVPDKDIDLEHAAQHFHRSVSRLRTEPQRYPHPIFGEMSVAEWDRMHLRHCELHLGFVDAASVAETASSSTA